MALAYNELCKEHIESHAMPGTHAATVHQDHQQSHDSHHANSPTACWQGNNQKSAHAWLSNMQATTAANHTIQHKHDSCMLRPAWHHLTNHLRLPNSIHNMRWLSISLGPPAA
jgi:hypothetical protein